MVYNRLIGNVLTQFDQPFYKKQEQNISLLSNLEHFTHNNKISPKKRQT